MKQSEILFRESQATFSPAPRLAREDWIESSFSQNPRALGPLRIEGVNNGRYEARQPILDVDGRIVGFLKNGASSIGYTFACLYAGNCFWFAHMGFGATLRGGDVSSVSIVDRTGKFLFSQSTRFEVVKSFGFEGGWVDDIRAYKLLDGGARLLYLTNYGACLFDTHRREIVATTDLRDLAYEWSGFAMSPKVKLLVVGCSKRGSRDPVDGEHRYRNFARIYNLETGLALGENLLPGDQQTRWLADFSQDGRMVRLSSDSRSFAFDLAARVPSSEAPIEYGN